MKCYEKVECPKCGSDEIGRSGRNENGVQRYRYKAWETGTRDTGRVLKISKDTVTNVLKKKKAVSSQSIQSFKHQNQKKD